MDLERAIECLMKNQARMDARFDAKFDRAEERFAQAEKRLDRLEKLVGQNNRLVAKLARTGVSLRSDVRTTQRNLAEVSSKLNVLIDVVDGHIQDNGRHR